MKQPVRTLAALAIIGACAPSAMAVSIKDDTVSLGLAVRLQTRAQINDATGSDGNDYRVGATSGAAALNDVDDPIDFSMRRTRLYLKIKYGDNWKGELAFAADKVDEDFRGDNRGLQVRYAWIERIFKMGDGMESSIKGGLMKPYNNPSDACMSSSKNLFPNGNAASEVVAPRGVGVEYMFTHPVFLVSADLQNNTTSAGKDDTGENNQESNGLYYGLRAEFSFSPDWFIKKRAESFLGKEGQGFNLGVSWAADNDRVVANAGGAEGQTTQSAIGVDALFHWNGLTAYAEYRTATTELTRNDGVNVEDEEEEYIVIQAGYAFPLEDGTVIEPAIRYQIIDEDTNNDNETSDFGNQHETGESGTQIDLGLNYYLSGHDNKFSLAVSLWEAEEGPAKATIIRLQHQLNF